MKDHNAQPPVPDPQSQIPSPDIAISVKNLSKRYHLYDNPKHRLKEALNPLGKKYHKDYYALNNISFEVAKGETVGIIGRNGSGKSTLLKIITGVLTPSEGTVTVNGKVSALLELGTGFNMEYTGIQNVYFSGTLMGYTKEEMDAKLDDILAFADIGDFIYQPAKVYSSGMFVRLAFAVATSVAPEILIVDEALAVGDMFFQAKCMTKMKKMIDSGLTLLFVSHDTGSVKSLCGKAALLHDGRLMEYDKSDRVVEKYFYSKVENEQKMSQTTESNEDSAQGTGAKANTNMNQAAFLNNEEFLRRASFQRIQNGKANFVNIQLLDENEKEIVHVQYGQILVLRMAVEVCEDIHVLAYGYHIRDKNGADIIYSDSMIEDSSLMYPKKGEKYVIDWKFRASLMQGSYTIACVLSIPINLELCQVDFCDFVPIAAQMQLQRRNYSYLYGCVHWDNTVSVKALQDTPW
ncbi:MAG: ABC transporter ATP-binding protein [Nitrospiraceae bacterium]|nr:ABC transporter ATP-binding protein [Nitrospiraceae bacterium]